MKKLSLSLLLFLCGNVNAQLAPGSNAPNFTVSAYQPWLSGSGSSSNGTYTLYQYLDAGYTVFLDVSATWCGPCWNYHSAEILDDLYAEHGPLIAGHPGVNANSTNDVMVLWVEGDPATADATMLDGAGAIGNWTNPTGSHQVQFPMANPNATVTNQIAADYAIGYFPTVYKICPNKTVYEVGQLPSAAQLYATVGSCPQPGLAANFTASSTSVCQGGTVTFSNQSTGSPTSYSWSFPGGTPSTSTAASPTITYSTPGIYSVTLTATNAGGSDQETKTNYITVVGNGSALPLNEGFTTTTFPPANWGLVNPNASTTTWTRNATIGNTPSAGNSMMFDNFSFNDSDDDEVRLKALNLTSLNSAQLTFDVAYAPYNANNYDGLQVLVSTDCGGTWTSVYNKSNTTLATAPATTAAFTPTAAQWRNETVNLASYLGQSKVIIAFKNLSGYGNRLFVDNINVSGTALASPGFSASPQTACTGQSITVTDASSGASSWSWNFGAGANPATATGAGPHTVSYSSGGTKTITLTINGSSTSTQTVTINSTPTPTITASGPTTFCAGNSVTLTSSSASGNSWSSGSSAQSIQVSTSGTYTLTTTSNGCTSSSASQIITVNPSPTIAVNTINPPTSCGTNTGSLVIGGTGSGSLSWSGNANGTLNSVTLPATIPNLGAGNYQVTFTSTSGCTSNQLAPGINDPSAPPTPVITASGPTTFCEGGSVTLTSSAASGNVWSNGTSGQTITISTPGTYSVTTTLNSCSSTSTGTVISVIPTPSIVNSGNVNSTNCVTPNGSISISGSGNGTLSWSGAGSGTLSTALPATITGLQAGTYSIQFVNQNGCSSNTLSQTISGPTAPAAPQITSTDNTPCQGDPVTIVSSQSSGNTWSTGATGSAINVTQSGSYSVTYTDNNGCTSAPASITILFNNLPNVTFGAINDVCIYNDAITLSQGLPAGGTYSGNGVNGNQFDPETAGLGISDLVYSFTDGNGCTNVAYSTVTVDGCASLNDPDIQLLTIYPNPANNLVNISCENIILSIKVRDLNGRLLFNLDKTSGSNNEVLEIGHLPNGVYQLVITTENGLLYGNIIHNN